MTSKIIYNLLWKFFERTCVQVISFVVSIILARLLEPADYGNVAIVMVFISLANVIIDGGLNSALIQKKNADIIDFSTIFYTTLVLSVIVYSALFFVSSWVGAFYGNIELVKIIRVLGITLFCGAVNSIQNAYLSKKLLFKKLFFCSFLGVVISGIIGIILALSGAGLWALVFQYLSLSITTMIVMWLTVKWRPKLVFSFERFSSLFNFGWKIFFTNIIMSLFENVRSLIIGKVYNSSSLAFFDRGKSVPSIVMDNVNASIQSVMFPVLSERQDNLDDIKNLMRKSIRLSSYVIFPLLVGLLVVAEPLVNVLLTEKWLNAVPYVRIFCVALIIMPIQNVNIVAIKAIGNSALILRLETIKKIIEVVILILSVKINVQAIAWGVVIYNFISLFINLYPAKKIIHYGYFQQFSDAAKPLLLSIIMGGSVLLLKLLILSPLLLLLLSTIVGVIVYVVISIISRDSSFYYIIDSFKKNINK